MIWLVVGFVLGISAPGVRGATDVFDWCYHDPSCNDTTWPALADPFCNGTRQSPIDLVNATVDTSLTTVMRTNFDSRTALKEIENTGRTVKVNFNSGVQVSGGNLSTTYDSLQFHLHWGNGSSVPGSEHTLKGRRFAMELHIVSIKTEFNGNTTLAVADPEGAAALGYFIEVDTTTTGQPESWKTLANLLQNITFEDDKVSLPNINISLDDLLPNIDYSKYYRYLGSLTTPLCQEAVVWTVFHDTVKVSSDLIDMFANTIYIGNTTDTPLMVNVYRNLQPPQPLSQSFSSGSKLSYSFGLFVLMAVLWMR